MINWNNMDTLSAYDALKSSKPIHLSAEMAGNNGAKRVKNYTVPMGAGMDFNYGARPVDDVILEKLAAFAKEAQLAEKFETLYNGAEQLYSPLCFHHHIDYERGTADHRLYPDRTGVWCKDHLLLYPDACNHGRL